MNNSKLIQLIKALEKRELTRLESFIRSPYFNKNKHITAIFQYIINFGPSFDHDALRQSNLLRQFNYIENFSQKKLTHLCSLLTKLVEEFYAVEHLKKQEIQIEFHKVKGLNDHHLNHMATLKLTQNQKRVAEKNNRDLDRMWHQYQCSRLAYELDQSGKRTFNPLLQKLSDKLDQFYLLEKLRHLFEITMQEAILNSDYEKGFATCILNNMGQQQQLTNHPLIKIYRTFLLLFQNKKNDRSDFQELKRLLEKNKTRIHPTELKQLYTGLLNYCIRKLNLENDKSFYKEYFLTNQWLLEEGFLYHQNQLSPWRYKNLVTVGLKLKEFQWVEKFIGEEKKKLPEDQREDVYQYCLAHYYYCTRKFDNAQRALSTIQSRDPLLSVSIRSLWIKLLFETEQYELLFSQLEATRIFLIRNKQIRKKLKNQMQSFVKITSQLARSKERKQNLAALSISIPPASKVMHQDWLKNRIRPNC